MKAISPLNTNISIEEVSPPAPTSDSVTSHTIDTAPTPETQPPPPVNALYPSNTPPPPPGPTHDFSRYDPIDNPYVPPSPSQSAGLSTAPSSGSTAHHKPHPSLKRRLALIFISVLILVGGGMLLNLLGFFTRQQTLACSISEKASDGGLVTMNLDFHYAGNSVDTADFKMSVDYSSSSEAQQKLAETENTLRETANTVINGSNGGASVDANVYAEGSRVIIDTHFSRDAFARTALATGITQTKSIDETKSSVESKLPGIICNIR